LGSADEVPSAEDSLPPSSTVRLLWAARTGDADALDRLFSRMAPGLLRWARGRLPRWARRGEDTADIVQDALIGVLGRLDRFEPRRRRALEAYLRQAVRNRVRDLVRSSGRRGPQEPLETDPVGAAPSPLDQTISADNADRLRRACAGLSEDDRALVVARLDLGYSYEQIALATGRNSPDAARIALKRALVRLADAMGQTRTPPSGSSLREPPL
jgi:RNA polymerase sigma factor (sigma-70 family)